MAPMDAPVTSSLAQRDAGLALPWLGGTGPARAFPRDHPLVAMTPSHIAQYI